MLKTYTLGITIFYSIALATVSLISIGKIPDYIPSFSDKIFHFLTYALLTFLWIITFVQRFNLKRTPAIIWAGIIAISFGIIIEILQDITTNTRVADRNDIFANVLGVLFIIIIVVIKTRIDVKKL